MNIFITGGTGFIGKNILHELSARDHHLFVLVRGLDRFHRVMSDIGLHGHPRITPILGDLSRPRLGMNEPSYQQILSSDIIIHAGGPMNIELSHTEAEHAFLRPAEELAALAKRIHSLKGLKHFIHVVGFMSPFNEEQTTTPLNIKLEKLPPYEQMKFKADSNLRQALRALSIPLSTVNPSVVIGHSYSGAAEQIGGLSILVDAVRRNMMPLVPGGQKYWLPMVHVDHTAAFISALVDMDTIASETYYLLDRKQDSLSMTAITRMIAKEMRVTQPIGSIPLPLIKSLLRTGAGKILGIPQESMSFIVQSDFPAASKERLARRNGLPSAVNTDALPFTIADLDFRLSHPSWIEDSGFIKRRRSRLATLEKEAEGMPLIVLHGTFSGASRFIPIARSLEDINVWLIDLPGLGRTPYHHHASVIDGYVESLSEMILQLDTPVALAGHSFGGLIAAKVMENIGSRIHRLLLLQPVLHPSPSRIRHAAPLNQILKHISNNKLRKIMLQNRHFTEQNDKLEDYVEYVVNDLRSSRVRKTTAQIMAALSDQRSTSLQPHTWNPQKVSLLWGDRDSEYHIPQAFEHFNITTIPHGHQFPISEPELTAQWIRDNLN